MLLLEILELMMMMTIVVVMVVVVEVTVMMMTSKTKPERYLSLVWSRSYYTKQQWAGQYQQKHLDASFKTQLQGALLSAFVQSSVEEQKKSFK